MNKNISKYDGAFSREKVKERIKLFTIEYFAKMIENDCISGNIIDFITHEIAWNEDQIKKNVEHGYGVQLYSHQKNTILEYCRINNFSLDTKIPLQSNAIEPIKWNGKNKNDLAYLFWKLKSDKIISINSFGNDLSKIFIDNKNNKIPNTLFNKYSSEFNKGKFPANVNEIDNLIQILKKGIDKS